MDVTCERCGTEYEFDETLLSGRGTSVKCTNCGHVFKVYPKAKEEADRTTSHWRLRTQDGSVETIDSLRDLQRRIMAGELTASDEIARGDQPWKPLGAIPELDTFFRTSPPASGSSGTLEQEPRSPEPEETKQAPSSDRPARKKTLLGVVPIAKGSYNPPPYASASESPGFRQPSAPPRGAAATGQEESAEQASSPAETSHFPGSQQPSEQEAQSALGEQEAQSALGEQEAQSALGARGRGARATRIGHPPPAMRGIEDAEYQEGVSRVPPGVAAPGAYYDDDEDLPSLPKSSWSWTRWLVVGLLVLLVAALSLRWEELAAWVGLAPDPATIAQAVETGDAAMTEDHLAAYERAITSYRSAADAAQSDPALALRLSLAYALAADSLSGLGAEQQDPVRAQQYARRALEQANTALMADPEDLGAAIARADGLRLLGMLQESQAQLSAAKNMPFFRTAEYFRVRALLRAAQSEGNLAKGYKSAEKAHDAEPDVIRYRLLLARAAMDAGDAPEAEAQLEAVLTEHPFHPAATSLRKALEAQQVAGQGDSTQVPGQDDSAQVPGQDDSAQVPGQDATTQVPGQDDSAQVAATDEDAEAPTDGSPPSTTAETPSDPAATGEPKADEAKTPTEPAKVEAAETADAQQTKTAEKTPAKRKEPAPAKAKAVQTPTSEQVGEDQRKASAPAKKAGGKKSSSGLAYDEYDKPSDESVNGRPPARDYNWHMRQARTYLARGDYSGARAQFESALEQRPGSPDPTDGLGEVAMAAGDPALALRYFRSAAQRGHQDAFFKLGTAYERLGRDEQAVSAYYTYLETHPSGRYAPTAKAAIKRLENDTAAPALPKE